MKQGASDAARKVEQTVEITKMKSQISSRDKDMEKLYTRIGSAVFHAYAAGDLSKSEDEVMDYCEQLSEIQQDIVLLGEKIKNIKLEKSCECGKVIPADAKFCPDCGKPFTEEPKPENTVGEIRVICSSCGEENDIGAKYCIQCGRDLAGTVTDIPQDNPSNLS
jgi:hypothetical protein